MELFLPPFLSNVQQLLRRGHNEILKTEKQPDICLKWQHRLLYQIFGCYCRSLQQVSGSILKICFAAFVQPLQDLHSVITPLMLIMSRSGYERSLTLFIQCKNNSVHNKDVAVFSFPSFLSFCTYLFPFYIHSPFLPRQFFYLFALAFSSRVYGGKTRHHV